MQKPDGEQAPSSNPKLPIDGGATDCRSWPRPQLRKSCTISGLAVPDADAVFQDSLFPAGDRVSTCSIPRRQLTVATDEPMGSHGAELLHRDWFYPSFLGGIPSRPRQPASRPMPGVGSSSRLQSPSLRLELGGGPGWGPVFSQTGERPAQAVRQDDKETDRVPVKWQPKPAVPALTSGSRSADLPRRCLGWRIFLIVNMLAATCLSSVLIVSSLRAKVMQLEEEISKLHNSCNSYKFSGKGSFGDPQSANRSFSSPLSYIDSRDVALATVVIALLTPFLMYKFLDNIPNLFSPSMRTRNTDEEVPLKKRLAYRVDVFFSVYPYAKHLALLFGTMLLIGFGGMALYAVTEVTFFEAMWLSWTFVADAGNHTDQVGVGRRIVSVSISAGGMLIFAMMLGLVSDAISEKVDSLRKGKSEVIERGHILILGWSDKLGSLLKQLAIANKSLGGEVIVVLAERDKEQMEIDIGKLEFDFMGTSVICRSGSPLILADLKKVSVSKARAIIVLASDENPDQSDARALRVVLSLTGVKEGLRGHVVVEMSDLDNEPLVKLVGGEIVETVVAHDVIGRLMIQCALQPGLAQIWEDILGFENAEFYIKRWPQLDGMRFENVHFSFPDAVPCGIKVAADNGRITINPSDDYVLAEGDEVLVIAEDDDTYVPGPLPEIRKDGLPDIMRPPKHPEKILFCGWRRDIDDMIMILILADEAAQDSIVHSDSRSLATLLLIRDIQSKRLPSKQKPSPPLHPGGFSHSSWVCEMQQASDRTIIISEILDSRTRNLVSVSRISDYVLSNELVSMALAMVAEDKQINRVLEELFAEKGNELYIRPAEFYLYDQEELSFFEVMARGRQREEIVIGFRAANTDKAVINPPDKMKPRRWTLNDVFVVISVG